MFILTKSRANALAILILVILLLILQMQSVVAIEGIGASSYGYGYGYMAMMAPSAGDVIINEFSSHPKKGKKEWIELFNMTNFSLILEGCSLEDARGTIYIFQNDAEILKKGFFVSIIPSNKLNNSGDRIRFICNNSIINELDYGKYSTGDSPATGTIGFPDENKFLPATKAGRSLGRVPDGGPTWFELAYPTPGKENKIINSPPKASIRVQGSGKTEGCSSISFNVTGEDSADPDNDRLQFQWKYFSEDSNLLLNETERKNPLSFKLKSSMGEHFTVQLVVTDSYGETGKASINVRLGACKNSSKTTSKIDREYQFSDKLIISEVFPNPVGRDSGSEFIELFNKGRIPILLDGWKLGGKIKKSLNGIYILPQRFLVFEKATLRNTGDRISLSDPNGNTIFTIEYPKAKEGKSWSRDENNIFRWTVPTKGRRNDFPFETNVTYLQASSPIIITKFLPNPKGKDEGREWIEIQNRTNTQINLNDWQLDNRKGGSRPFPLMSLVSLYPWETKKIFSSESHITLRNTADQVRLIDSQGRVIDLLEWKTPAASGQIFSRNQLIRDLSIDPEVALVAYVVDGDTIDVRINGEVERVRLIGVDTPETVHPFKPLEYFGKEASAYTKSRLEGKTIRLEYDLTKRGKYGRLLAYVWLGNTHFNAELVRKGYAFAYLKYPFQYREEFRQLEKKAREERLGLWANENIKIIKEKQETVQDKELEELEVFEEKLKENEEEPSEQIDLEKEKKDWDQEGWDMIRINEILSNPKGKDSLIYEYIELLNQGNKIVDLSGWKLVNGKKKNILKFSGLITSRVRLFHPDKNIKNSSETLSLIDPFGNVRDEFTYEKAVKDDQVWALSPLTNTWNLLKKGSPGEANTIILLSPGNDMDGDGIKDEDEGGFGFSPSSWDSDENGIPDDAELLLRNGLIESYQKYLGDSLSVRAHQTKRTLRFSGESRPYTSIEIKVMPEAKTIIIPAQSNGTWETKISIGIEAGGHRFFFLARDPYGVASEREHFLDISLEAPLNVGKLNRKRRRKKKKNKGLEPFYMLIESEKKEEFPSLLTQKHKKNTSSEPLTTLTALTSLLLGVFFWDMKKKLKGGRPLLLTKDDNEKFASQP